MTYTSIQISPQTRKRLARFKESERETYDSLLNKLMELVPSGDDEGEYTEQFRLGLLNARISLKEGRTISHEKAKKALGA